PVDLTLGGLDGPTLTLEPAEADAPGTRRVIPRPPYQQTERAAPPTPPQVTAPDPSWRPVVPAPAAASAAGPPDRATPPPPGYPPQPGFPPQPGYPSQGGGYPSPSWGGPPAWGAQPVAPPGSPGDDFGNALRILFPLQSWLHNSGWRQGLRLGVIVY